MAASPVAHQKWAPELMHDAPRQVGESSAPGRGAADSVTDGAEPGKGAGAISQQAYKYLVEVPSDESDAGDTDVAALVRAKY